MISLKKRQSGFTIVELLIVIVVIGILAALVITTYNGIQQKARNTERTTDINAIQGQLEAYYAEKGAYPSTADLGTTSANNVTWIASNMKGLDKEALRDPNGTTGDYSLSNSGAVAGKYDYAPAHSDGTACTTDDTANPCTSYKLIATYEGSVNGSTTYEKDSLN